MYYGEFIKCELVRNKNVLNKIFKKLYLRERSVFFSFIKYFKNL